MTANPISRLFTNTTGTPAARPSTAPNIPSNVLPPAFCASPAPIIPGRVRVAPGDAVGWWGHTRGERLGDDVESARWAGRMTPEPGARRPACKRCLQSKARMPKSACAVRAAFLFFDLNFVVIGLVPVGRSDVVAGAGLLEWTSPGYVL